MPIRYSDQEGFYWTTVAAEGATTAPGAGAGTSFIDASLAGAGANSFVAMLAILYPGDPQSVDSKSITAFNTGTGEVTLAGAYKGVAAPIPAGVPYRIVAFRFAAADVAALAIIVDAIGGKISYTEDSVSDTTGNAYADALDVDTRGMKSMSAVVSNTHGANSLDWRIRARASNYTAGADEEIPECPGEETLAFGEKGLMELMKAYSRIKIQVKSTVADTPATYNIDYLINR